VQSLNTGSHKPTSAQPLVVPSLKRQPVLLSGQAAHMIQPSLTLSSAPSHLMVLKFQLMMS
jgi:hypothetical protein